MARLGINLPVIEKILNHTSGSFGGVAGVYQRHSFSDEKAKGSRSLGELRSIGGFRQEVREYRAIERALLMGIPRTRNVGPPRLARPTVLRKYNDLVG